MTGCFHSYSNQPKKSRVRARRSFGSKERFGWKRTSGDSEGTTREISVVIFASAITFSFSRKTIPDRTHHRLLVVENDRCQGTAPPLTDQYYQHAATRGAAYPPVRLERR